MGGFIITMTYQTVSVRIPNANNLGLAVEIYRPEVAGRLPVVFIFHGFTGYKESADLVDLADRLAQKGIVAVRFTASGFGDSEGSLEHDCRFTNHRSDAHMVYEYVQKLPYVDDSRVGVFGHSMGGKLAVLFAADHPSVSALVAASAPVVFSGTAYGELMPEWKRDGFFEKVSGRDNRTIRVPYAYAVDADSAAHDVLEAARSVHSPHALVVAGDADREVPWQETEKIYTALNCPKEFIKLPGVPHKYGHTPTLIPVVNTPIAAFFVSHL